jgi:CheY-like chemotaxis protein
VTAAQTGGDALAQVRDWRPHAIVLEIRQKTVRNVRA